MSDDDPFFLHLGWFTMSFPWQNVVTFRDQTRFGYMLETGFLKRDRTWWDKDVGSELLYPNFVKIVGSLKQWKKFRCLSGCNFRFSTNWMDEAQKVGNWRISWCFTSKWLHSYCFFPNQVKWLGGIESWFPSFGTKSATSAGKGRERSWTVWILRHRQWARAEGQSDENKPAYSIIWILSWPIFYWTFVFSFRFASFSSLSSIGLWNTESTLQANISFSEKRYDNRTDLPSCMDVWVPWFDIEACGWNLAEISRNRVVDCSKGSTSSSHFGKCAQSCDMKSKLRIYNCNLNPSKINCTSLRVAIYPFLVVSPWLMGVLQKSPKYVVDNPRHVRCYSPLLEKCVYRYHLVFMTQADNIMCDSMSCKSKCWLKFFNPKNAKTDPWIGISLCMVYVTPQVMLTVCSLTLKYVCTAELWLEGMSNRFWMCSMFWQPIQSCTACRTFT